MTDDTRANIMIQRDKDTGTGVDVSDVLGQ